MVESMASVDPVPWAYEDLPWRIRLTPFPGGPGDPTTAFARRFLMPLCLPSSRAKLGHIYASRITEVTAVCAVLLDRSGPGAIEAIQAFEVYAKAVGCADTIAAEYRGNPVEGAPLRAQDLPKLVWSTGEDGTAFLDVRHHRIRLTVEPWLDGQATFLSVDDQTRCARFLGDPQESDLRELVPDALHEFKRRAAASYRQT